MHDQQPFSTHQKPGSAEVIKYLARYTRKVAIANSRLVSLKEGQVAFSFRDYADGGQVQTAQLPAPEFIRRFLLHVPTPKFVRIRHFRFLANGQKKAALALCRALLQTSDDTASALEKTFHDTFAPGRCPHCRIGTLLVVADIAPVLVRPWDSS